jgi:Xaa-Pro aminopeptidase
VAGPSAPGYRGPGDVRALPRARVNDALLLVGGSERTPEIRHEIAAAVPDPVIWLARGEEATVWASPLDLAPLRDAGAIEDVRSADELGYSALRRDLPYRLVFAEMARRALEADGIRSVGVPWDFPVGIADALRDAGVEVVTDPDEFAARRRAKREWELEGMRAAGRAAQAALLEAAALLRDEPDGLTCERVRERMVTTLLALGAESEEILIHAGDGLPEGHDLGFGPIEPDLPVQIDCFPRHRASGLYIDMSRTWVVGTPSAAAERHWQDCMDAFDVALADARPGVEDLYDRACAVLEARGHPTQRRPGAGLERPERGFRFSLGHGVGFEVHEAPSLGRRPEALAEGDLVAIEPSLGYEGVGFVMVEETVQVTPEGGRMLLEPLPYGLRLPGT